MAYESNGEEYRVVASRDKRYEVIQCGITWEYRVAISDRCVIGLATMHLLMEEISQWLPIPPYNHWFVVIRKNNQEIQREPHSECHT